MKPKSKPKRGPRARRSPSPAQRTFAAISSLEDAAAAMSSQVETWCEGRSPMGVVATLAEESARRAHALGSWIRDLKQNPLSLNPPDLDEQVIELNVLVSKALVWYGRHSTKLLPELNLETEAFGLPGGVVLGALRFARCVLAAVATGIVRKRGRNERVGYSPIWTGCMELESRYPMPILSAGTIDAAGEWWKIVELEEWPSAAEVRRVLDRLEQVHATSERIDTRADVPQVPQVTHTDSESTPYSAPKADSPTSKAHTLKVGDSGKKGPPSDRSRAVSLRHAAKQWFGCEDETLRKDIAEGVYLVTRIGVRRFVFDVAEVVDVGIAKLEDVRAESASKPAD